MEGRHLVCCKPRDVSLFDCQRALELHSDSLLAIPGVQGIGIRDRVERESQGRCAVRVYLATEIARRHIPTELSVTSEAGFVVRVPVEVEFQGPLTPE